MYARKNESRRYPRRVTKSYTRDRNTLTRNLEFARELFGKLAMRKEKNRRRNLSDEDTLKSEKLTEKFHGRAPREMDEIEETEEFYDTFAVLGDLTELGIIGEEIDSFHIIEDEKEKNGIANLDVDSFDIQFETKIPKICVDPEGNCLEVIGGDQRLKTGDNKNQEQYVGPVWKIAYRTDKHHLEGSDGSVQEYEHHFGEEGKLVSTKRQNGFKIIGPIQVKDLPRLVYDNVNKKVRLVSGSYTVEAEGIKN